jgi:uncharacterized paraquat-inducible protein A
MDAHRRPCETCDTTVSLSDLERGRAVMVMKRAYCGRCSERIAASGSRTPRRARLLAAAAIAITLGALLALLLSRRPF